MPPIPFVTCNMAIYHPASVHVLLLNIVFRMNHPNSHDANKTWPNFAQRILMKKFRLRFTRFRGRVKRRNSHSLVRLYLLIIIYSICKYIVYVMILSLSLSALFSCLACVWPSLICNEPTWRQHVHTAWMAIVVCGASCTHPQTSLISNENMHYSQWWKWNMFYARLTQPGHQTSSELWMKHALY